MITAKSYTLSKKDNSWLGQIVLTSDGMFSAVTDYGNYSYAWRSTGSEDFRKFILSINADYFGRKIYQGITYMVYGKKYEKVCMRFAEEILPALKEVLQNEIDKENGK